jgi:competence protein ComEC
LRLPDFKKYPAVLTAIPLALGIGSSYFLNSVLPSTDRIILISLQIFLLFCSLFLYHKTVAGRHRLYFLLFLILLLFGLVRFQFSHNSYSDSNISSKIDKYKDKDIILYGSLAEEPEVKGNSVRLLIDADSIFSAGTSLRVDGYVLAVIYKNRFKESSSEKLDYGDLVALTGKLELLPHRRNPGEFDYGEFLRLHGVDASFFSFGYDNISVTGASNQNFFEKYFIYPVKKYSIKVVDDLVGNQEGEFLKGLLLGERSNISKETKEDFVNAGVAHIIAVSGLNVAYVIIITGAVLMVFPVRRDFKILLLVCFLFYYMNLTGNVPSIVRATIMASVFLLSQLFERKPISYNIIAFSAIAILLIDPRQLFDAGFILSYSAVLSIVYFYPKLKNLVVRGKLLSMLNEDKYLHRFINASLALILGTLAAQIGTLPITALMFKKISIVSLFTNLPAIPLSNFALAAGFLVVICSTFSVWLADVFAGTAAFILHWLLEFINFSANLDFSFVETYSVNLLLLVFYYLIIFILFASSRENIRARIVISILLAANYFLYDSILNADSKVKLSYLDVGNSSSCLISSPGGYNILVNPGTSGENYSSAERNVIPYLKSQSIGDVDLLVITSLNKDEFKNLIQFVIGCPVSRIVVPSYYKGLFENNSFKPYFKNSSVEFIEESEILKCPGNFRLYASYGGNLFPSPSMYIQLLYGKQLFSFSDSKDVREDHFYSLTNLSDTARVLKVPSSGSFNFTSPQFIVWSNPQNVVISSSRSYKRLNSDIFVKSLEGIGINVLKIKETGAVIFETDGLKTERVEWR